MPTAKTRRPTEQVEEQPAPLPVEPILQAVFAQLGKPHDLYRIDAHRYDTARCRVNVYRKVDKEAATAHFERLFAVREAYSDHEIRQGCEKLLREMEGTISGTVVLITDSFFLRTTAEGQIVGGDEITRRYE